MESGKFAQARRAFEFHKSIQLVALSHRSQAQMAGIALEVDLDSAIDKIGGVFLGDEMRLRQVASRTCLIVVMTADLQTSNLVSNSIKFTETGSVKIVTKLLYPRVEPTPSTEIDDPLQLARVNAARQAHITPINDRDAITPVINEKTGSTMVDDQAEDKEKAWTTTGPSTANASATWGSGDVEKAVQVPTLTADGGRRRSVDSAKERTERDERNRYKAIVRVEVHDTGVGLRKQDVVE
jgi:signal transduction histidine kinase